LRAPFPSCTSPLSHAAADFVFGRRQRDGFGALPCELHTAITNDHSALSVVVSATSKSRYIMVRCSTNMATALFSNMHSFHRLPQFGKATSFWLFLETAARFPVKNAVP